MTGVPTPVAARAIPPVHGVLVIDKPEGPTSHDVVAATRRALGVRQVGHTGTLDPMATGVLALVVGRATRLAQFLSGRDKKYAARIRLGVATDTWDRTGRVVREADPGDPLPGAGAVADALRLHLGVQGQVPPPFSAKKMDGVRAYALARRGQAVELEAATVALHTVAIEAFEPPFVDIRLTCSAGFYVRALADSLGRRLGCGACLETLRRTASGAFTLAQAVPLAVLDELGGRAVDRMVPIEQALPDVPAVVLTADGARRALHGNDVGPGDWSPVRLKPDAPDRPADEVRLNPDATDRPADDLLVQPDATRETAAWNPALAGWEAGNLGFVQLLSPDGRLLALARPAGSGVLHPAVVLR